ncbi:hypothetical protein BGZ63DRAFT_422535 [Mariannaea sp. PMI_226]|nr:hypothetical protein BGZ63DRAFT_422535 [Mariannaea sp. PMI_226]
MSQDLGSLFASPSPSPPSELLVDQANLLRLVDENLRLGSPESSSPEPRVDHVRSTSSSYPTVGINSTRVQSPVGQPVNKLSLDNLSLYGRSASSSSKSRAASTASSTQEAIAEAARVTLQWQGERVPLESYRQYELSSSPESSPEIYPEDSASQRARRRYPHGKKDSDDTCVDSVPDTRLSRYSGINALKSQYDGATDIHLTSRFPSIQPDTSHRGSKRKASSAFNSIRPVAKRARTDIQKIVNNAYQGGTRRFSQARDTIRRQHKEDMRQYAAWKSLRRRQNPGDAIKGKFEKGFTAFAIERSRYGHEMWWRDGVEKYHAPEWMKFDAEFKKGRGIH